MNTFMLEYKFKVGDYVKVKSIKSNNSYHFEWLTKGAKVYAVGAFEGKPHYCLEGSTSFWCESDLENKETNL
tara:strand:- start:74 stop:289 length:216 start_codon:yes stop_codon:yes gene_type:complete